MNYDFQKNSFLKQNNVTVKNTSFNSIRKTPEQIKEEMLFLKSSHIIHEKKSELKSNHIIGEEKPELKSSHSIEEPSKKIDENNPGFLKDKIENINSIKRWK